MADWKPTDKVAAGGSTAAAVLVLAWLLSLVGVDLPVPVQLALGTLLPTLVSYLVPERKGRHAGN
jgi:hypothetical protein